MVNMNFLKALPLCLLPMTMLAEPRWMSVMPLVEEPPAGLVEDAVFLGERTIADGIAWICTLVPEGEPAMDKAAVYARRFRQVAPRVRERSKVRQGFLLQATIGHGWTPGSPTPWQKFVRTNGTSPYRFCPLGAEFRAYLAEQCRTLAAEKPDFFMTDDDLRLLGKIDGCFCPLHLKGFAERTGRTWSREELVKRLEAGEPELLAQWNAYTVSTVESLVRLIRAQFPDDVPGLFCACDGPRLGYVTNCTQAIAGPGFRPAARLGSAPYWSDDLESILGIRRTVARQISVLGQVGDVLIEADTCPQNRWQTSATHALDFMTILTAEGCRGAKMWWHRTASVDERRSSAAYLSALSARTGLLKWLAASGFQAQGVWCPMAETGSDWGANVFGRLGFAYHYGARRTGDVAALTADSAAVLDGAALTNVLSGPLILDGSAAIALAKRGFGDLVGVRAKPWQGKAISFEDFGDGRRSYAIGTSPADLSDTAKGVVVLSELHNRVSGLSSESTKLAPGSVLFRNARGGTVLSLAATIPAGPDYKLWDFGYCNETRKAWLAEQLRKLAGGIPGGVYSAGDTPLLCESGVTKAGERIVILDSLDLDELPEPELVVEKMPAKVQRLADDGTWQDVGVRVGPDGGLLTLKSRLTVQRAAIFRLRE